MSEHTDMLISIIEDPILKEFSRDNFLWRYIDIIKARQELKDEIARLELFELRFKLESKEK